MSGGEGGLAGFEVEEKVVTVGVVDNFEGKVGRSHEADFVANSGDSVSVTLGEAGVNFALFPFAERVAKYAELLVYQHVLECSMVGHVSGFCSANDIARYLVECVEKSRFFVCHIFDVLSVFVSDIVKSPMLV